MKKKRLQENICLVPYEPDVLLRALRTIYCPVTLVNFKSLTLLPLTFLSLSLFGGIFNYRTFVVLPQTSLIKFDNLMFLFMISMPFS